MLLHIRNRATGPARKLRGGTPLSRWLFQAAERKSGRSSGHGQSSGAVYPFWLGSARTGSFVKLTLNLSKHRSVINAFVHIIAAITAYQINPFKPKRNLQPSYQLETTA